MTSQIELRYLDARKILAEMGEWMALGFYEGLDLPWPRAYGLAFRRLYEHMTITIPEQDLLLPHEPLPQARTMTSHGAWFATALICDFNHDRGLRVNPDIAQERKQAFPQHAAFIDALVEDLQHALPHFGGYTHSNPDIRRVVHDGFDAMERELDGEIAAVTAQGDHADSAERNLLAALKDYAVGVRTFHTRAAGAIRQAADRAVDARWTELTLVADSFAACFLTPSTTFLQGLLAVHFAWLLDGCDSIGRLDQALGPLYEDDIQSGALTPEFARRLIDELFMDFERLNGWNLQVGGYRPDGQDGYNALSRELIIACDRNKVRRPNVAFRITRATPPEGLRDALAALRQGSGRPALYNDDLYVRTINDLDLGVITEDAREIGFGGCTETMIAGMSNVGSLEGDLNLAKALELAIHDGRDSLSGRQLGPHTGRFQDFIDFAAFLAAVKRQIQYAIDEFVACNREELAKRFTQGDPKLYRTFFTRDCVTRRKSFEAGGARYNWAVVNFAGAANLLDSLSAIRRCVYEEHSVTADELVAALLADFAGHEDTRRRLSGSPKFGNDDSTVDDLGREVITFAWQELYRHETPRGGRYVGSCIMFTTYGWQGARVGALPDGRRAGAVVADSIGPVQGCDIHGPTAMLQSVAKLPLSLAIGTPVLNIRFQKQYLATPTGLAACASLIHTFFDLGGLQLQVSVLDREEMLAAQREPEQHRDLIVRIGGFSEYFTNLDPALQASVIARTEYGEL